jgi:hypothetical protein
VFARGYQQGDEKRPECRRDAGEQTRSAGRCVAAPARVEAAVRAQRGTAPRCRRRPEARGQRRREGEKRVQRKPPRESGDGGIATRVDSAAPSRTRLAAPDTMAQTRMAAATQTARASVSRPMSRRDGSAATGRRSRRWPRPSQNPRA